MQQAQVGNGQLREIESFDVNAATGYQGTCPGYCDGSDLMVRDAQLLEVKVEIGMVFQDALVKLGIGKCLCVENTVQPALPAGAFVGLCDIGQYQGIALQLLRLCVA